MEQPDSPPIRRMSDLDRLPWFEKDAAGRIRLRDDAGLPPVVDVHAHVGWCYGLSPRIDMSARTESVRYLYDYEEDQDLLFGDTHPTERERKIIGREMLGSLLWPGASALTHTAANLADEMDRFNYRHICLSPIEIPLFPRHAEETLRASRLDPRFIPFAAVYPRPWGAAKRGRLEYLAGQGAPALKYHPEFQFIPPDAPAALELLGWCAGNGMPVLAHSGYTGAEPAWLRAYAEPERFVPALEAFPKLQLILGHSGLTRLEAALAVAGRFREQVWLDLSGQPVPGIRRILAEYDPERIVFGSDWPFYPLAVALARTLVAAQGAPGVLRRLLHDNAARLLGLAEGARGLT